MTGSAIPQADVILERITNVQGDVSEIKTSVGCLSKDSQTFQRQYIRDHSEVTMKVSASHRRLDEHELRMKAIEAQMQELRDALHPLIITNRILGFIGGAVGLSVIALIWSLVTGRAILLIP
jgi:hypothetical protein